MSATRRLPYGRHAPNAPTAPQYTYKLAFIAAGKRRACCRAPGAHGSTPPTAAPTAHSLPHHRPHGPAGHLQARVHSGGQAAGVLPGAHCNSGRHQRGARSQAPPPPHRCRGRWWEAGPGRGAKERRARSCLVPSAAAWAANGGAGNWEFRANVRAPRPHWFSRAGALQSAPDGAPAFFHRTSFNSKFFPNCLGRKDEAYCEVRRAWLARRRGHGGRPVRSAWVWARWQAA